MNRVFSVAREHAPKDGLTISTPARLASETSVTWFSLGSGTDISAESYDAPVLYVGMTGEGRFGNGAGDSLRLGEGDALLVAPDTPCGASTEEGLVYAEVMPRKDLTMNKAVHAGEVFKLAELLPYEDGSVVNMDVASNEAMKFVVMAFDDGQALSPHRAPGDALVFALEGRATIGYEGGDHPIEAGETFRFEKGGLHAVTANGRFKMALLLTLR